jgi:hypothetical protein
MWVLKVKGIIVALDIVDLEIIFWEGNCNILKLLITILNIQKCQICLYWAMGLGCF